MTEKDMMKEALEWQEYIRELITDTDYELYHKRSKVFDWLVEQAERVQELEEVLLQNKYDKALYEKKVIEWLELKEENKRYREAIDRALKEGVTIKDCDEAINHIYGILGEALEGET